MYKHRYLTVLILLITTSYTLFAQTRYPIYVHPVLTPPYSLRISDYGQAGSTRLVIHVNVNDFTVTNLPVRLHIKMENLSGGSVETHPNAAVMPIYLNGGEVRIFFGEDLAPYFNIDNLVFSGYSKEQYRRTGQLQEGFYRITVHVRHFLTGRIISNEGPAMGWFALGKPPQLISPNNDAELGQVQGSPLVFSWQHSSPAVPGAMIQYNFEMWDLRLPEISPYVYVNSMPAMHSSTERMSPLQIYPAMLNLEPGMRYAWRVTAFDMMNQVPFEQDGKSEVRTFTYLSKCDAPTNLRVEEKGKDAVYTWDADSKHTSYTVEAENVTTGFNNIYTLYDNKKTLKGLDYGHEYRLRVRAVCNNNDMYPSDFSDWKTFRLTPPPERDSSNNYECGNIDKSTIPPITNYELRRDLKEG
ncbi:MAG: fibronectin type III domain-containing protein, partial [Bacteroidales bacterium]|nr:fibronectin type III domain-containing protein [Bacteroidales bacterium]